MMRLTDGNPGHGHCIKCGEPDETRFGVCFPCAWDGEFSAAHRTVLGHVLHGVWHILTFQWLYARVDFMWARERHTKTGDYAPGGEFERQYGIKL